MNCIFQKTNRSVVYQGLLLLVLGVASLLGVQAQVDIIGVPLNPTVTNGQTFTVTLEVQAGTQPVNGVGVHLDFDPSALEVVSLTNEATVLFNNQIVSPTFSNTSGTIDIVSGYTPPPLGTPSPPTGTFDFLTIEFEAVALSGSTILSFSNAFPRETNITPNGLGNANDITITESVSTPQLAVDRSSQGFGNVLLSNTDTRSITATNTGSGPLTINSISLSGASSFSIAGGGGTGVLQPGDDQVIDIEFTPTANGQDRATLTIDTDGGTEEVLLGGFGAITPTSISGMRLERVWARVGDTQADPLLGVDQGVASVEAAEFSPDGQLIATGAKLGFSVRLWDLAGNLLWTNFHTNEVETIGWTRDGQYVISAGEDFEVRVWEAATGNAVTNFTLNSSIDGLRFSHDGLRMAVGDEWGLIHIFDTSDPDPVNWVEIFTVEQGPDQDRPGGGVGHSDINSIDWTNDDRFIAVAGRNETVRLYEVDEMGNAANNFGFIREYTGFQSSIKSTRISPDETLIAAGGQDSPEGLTIIWDFATGVEVDRIAYTTNRKIEAVEWTPDGQYLITGGTEGSALNSPPYENRDGYGYLRAYDVDDNFKLTLEHEVFRQEYYHFNESGTQLVGGHEDGGVRLWNVVPGGSEPQVVARIYQSSDDAEEQDDGSMFLDSNDFDMGDGGASSQPEVALRFTLPIEQGQNLANAYIEFTSDGNESDPADLTITVEAVDDAATFTNTPFDISNRTKSTNSITWNPAPWGALGERGPAQRTPDLSGLIQEIVNRPGWSSRNSIVFIISSPIDGQRQAASWDSNLSKEAREDAAHLYVDFGPSNLAPAITAIPSQTNTEGDVVSLQVSATDADVPAQTLTYAATGLPAGLSIDVNTGEISGTISAGANAGSPYSVTVTVTDDGTPAESAVETFDWTVNELIVNTPPVVTIGDQTDTEGDAISLQVVATDADVPAQTLTYAAAGLPAGLSIDANTGLILGTISAGANAGSPYSVTVTVTDDGAPTPEATDANFTWTVNELIVNTPPVVTIGDQTNTEGDVVSLLVNATDADVPAQTLTYAATNLPTGLSIDANTGEISGTIAAGANANSPYSVTVTVTDDGAPAPESTDETFSWTVEEPTVSSVADFIIDEKLVAPDSQVIVAVTVNNFIGQLGGQGSITWDPTIITFDSTSDVFNPTLGFNNPLSGSNPTPAGNLTFAYFDPTLSGLTLNDGDTLFTIYLQAIGVQGDVSLVNFSGAPTGLTFENTAGIYTPNLENGSVEIPNPVAISGSAFTEPDGSGTSHEVEGVTYTLVDPEDNTQSQGGNAGDFGFSFTVQPPLSYGIGAFKNNDSDITRGVNISDLLAIQGNLLNIAPLSSNYKLLAADVNSSGTINVSDILQVQEMILSIRTGFPSPSPYVAENRLWAFADAERDFGPLTSNPPSLYADSLKTVTVTAASTGLDFVAMKLGDVNNTWTPNPSGLRQEGNPVYFSLDQVVIPEEGGMVEIPIRVQDFIGITGYQFTLNWDPALLELVTVKDGSLEGVYNLTEKDAGYLTTLWMDYALQGITLADQAEIARLVFRVKGERGESGTIHIGSDVTPAMVIETAQQPRHLESNGLAYRIGQVTTSLGEGAASAFRFGPAVPNPFNDKVEIAFVLPQAEEVTVTIFNQLGQQVWQHTGRFEAGENRLPWQGQGQDGQRLSDGVYSCRFESASYQSSLQMIKLR